jgi:hypothetical protein
MISQKLVLRSHPANIELLVIERAQSLSTQAAGQHDDPWRNDGCNVLEEVVGCSKL